MLIEHKEEINITSNKINCSLTREEAEELYSQLALVLNKQVNPTNPFWPSYPEQPYYTNPYKINCGSGSISVNTTHTKIVGNVDVGGISSGSITRKLPTHFSKTSE